MLQAEGVDRSLVANEQCSHVRSITGVLRRRDLSLLPRTPELDCFRGRIGERGPEFILQHLPMAFRGNASTTMTCLGTL